MAELAKSKRVYSAPLHWVVSVPGVELHTIVAPADLWVPPGDIRIIGVALTAVINPIPPVDWTDGAVFVTASVSMLPAQAGQVNDIASAHARLVVVETPTIGEYQIIGEDYAMKEIFFPEPLGFATNEWHPIYLNADYAHGFAVPSELSANAHIYFVEL